jgi:hypothetical protein
MPILTLRRTLPLVIVLLGLRAAAQSPAPAAPPPADAALTAAVAGKWKMTVDVESSDRTSTLDIKLDGNKVSGTCTAPSGEFPLSGELTDGKLTFTMNYQNLKLMFSGGLKDDGTLAGTMDYGQGPNNWKAERIKEK